MSLIQSESLMSNPAFQEIASAIHLASSSPVVQSLLAGQQLSVEGILNLLITKGSSNPSLLSKLVNLLRNPILAPLIGKFLEQSCSREHLCTLGSFLGSKIDPDMPTSVFINRVLFPRLIELEDENSINNNKDPNQQKFIVKCRFCGETGLY